ncbi:hypothetical protein [Streptacidiphilus anmyonensis]|uniref:hypothetical protein n=1 Tax=Streptacidiphilus anmyonensis TaxID=405782 RepID=UPI0005A834DA|nr:hypothetical protein [Streptacidiphilus anmyonensis]
MTDYTVRELMDKALEGLRPPTEDITDAVLAQASRRQHRRRAGALVATSAGLALVAGLVVMLPHTANGAVGAANKPGPVSATTKAAAPKPLEDPAAVVQSLLPPGIGTVTKLKDLPPTPMPPGRPKAKVWPQSRYDGTYVITKGGRSAALIIESYDPKAVPAQRPFGPDTASVCNETPASWNCAFTRLAGGAGLLEQTEPPGTYGEHAGIVNTASVSYPDKRAFYVIATSGTTGLRPGVTFGGVWGENPPLDRAQLAAFAENPVWFG